MTVIVVPVVARAVEEPTKQRIEGAIRKAIPLLEKGARGFAEQRDCFSCHHQTMPVVALATARGRGFEVDTKVIQEQVDHTTADLKKAIESYRKGSGQGGGVTRAGYALWALEAGGAKPDETTAAVAEFLLTRDAKKGYWRSSSRRPPSEISHFTATYVALLGLKAFATPEQGDRAEARVAAAREWLISNRGDDTEDRVFRLRALKLAGAPAEDVALSARDLLDRQREDGGWGQLDDSTKSDAYATGSTLVALHDVGALAADAPAYRRGLSFLLDDQQADGSWHVATRSRPFQVYLETGFPHGKDQFISMAATGWATTALALACPPVPK
jgi:hypothetical protein